VEEMTHDKIMKLNDLSKFDDAIIVGSEIRGVIAEYEKNRDKVKIYQEALENIKEELESDPTTRTCYNVVHDINEVLGVEETN
jgi:hypothetical protein